MEVQDLMQVTVPKRSKKICEIQNPYSNYMELINFDLVICTGGDSGKDSCSGDSGGPAIVVRDGRPCLVGVLSIASELPASGPACGLLYQ